MIKKIMVIAPAESLKENSPNRLFAEKRIREYFGCELVYGAHTMTSGFLNSASVAQRVEDFHNAFLDTTVDIILSAKGGYNSNDILPYIDWEIVKNNPKPFIGSSDITVLINAIFAKTGIQAIYGPTFIDFSNQKGFEYSMEYFDKVLSSSTYDISPSLEWSDDNFFQDQINRNFIKNDGPYIVQEGTASGVLLGGNLCSLNLLQGTHYMPICKNMVLFIEDDDLAGNHFLGEFNRNLTSFLQSIDTSEIKAILIGRNQINSEMSTEKIKNIFDTKKISKNIPIIANLDFGHTKPTASILIGAIAHIVAKDSNVSIKIEK